MNIADSIVLRDMLKYTANLPDGFQNATRPPTKTMDVAVKEDKGNMDKPVIDSW